MHVQMQFDQYWKLFPPYLARDYYIESQKIKHALDLLA